MELQELKARLAKNPGDWDTRCSIAQAHYDAEQYSEAAQIMTAAPEIPFDEQNVLFAATIIGTADHEAGHSLLDQFIQATPTENAYELKAQLFEMAEDAKSAASCRAAFSKGKEVAKPSPQPSAAVPVAPVKKTESAPLAPTGSGPLVPKSLKPPGSEEEKVSRALPPGALIMSGVSHPVSLNMQLSQPVPLNFVETVEHAHLNIEPGTERALIVGEGEMIHGVEAPTTTNERLGAIIAAVIVHVVIAVLLLLAKVAMPRPNPPQITASSYSQGPSESSLEVTTMIKQTQKSSAAVSSSVSVVTSNTVGSFAVPEMKDSMSDLAMVSMSDGDAGFGMSMSGFSDVSNMGAIPAGMRSRCSMSERMKRLRESGGEDRAERAVRKGLEYLTSLQDKETGSIGGEHKAAMTGLTLLAYLGHCETPESPKFGDAVVKAALYLMERGFKNDGLLITPDGQGNGHSTYEHAIATYALAELYTMTKASGKEIPRLESVLKKAADKIVDAQDQLGGWSYGFKGGESGKEDMSVSGWMIQALKACHNTGKNFSKVDKALDEAVKKYLPAIQDDAGHFKYNPKPEDKGKPSLTGAALLGMQIWDQMGSPAYDKGLAALQKSFANPTPGNNFYTPYYNTQAFFMHGGKEWENYNKKFQPKLLDAQNEDGSWTKGNAVHNMDDSPIMNTAWAILMLEVYYRYLPTTDKVKDLKVR